MLKPNYLVDIYHLANLQHMKYMCQTRLTPPRNIFIQYYLNFDFETVLSQASRGTCLQTFISFCAMFGFRNLSYYILNKLINSVTALATKMVEFSNTVFVNYFI